jgi:hypothetical protein
VSAFGASAFDIQWGNRKTYQNHPSNTLRLWAEGVESRSGTGVTFYVDSGVASGGDSTGSSWTNAVTTIDAGINLCTASRGDVVKVAQGHTETLAAAGTLVTCDIIGAKIVGMGSGSLRPSITLSDDEAIAFEVTAASVTIENIYIDATGADQLAKPIDVGAVRCTIDSVEVLMADGTGQAVTAITTSGAANAADYMAIINCRFVAPDAGAAEAILLEEVEEGVVISGCYAYGDFSVAPIHNPTGKVLTNLMIRDCILKNDNAGEFSLELVSACTGFLIGNYYQGDDDQILVDPGSCFSYQCFGLDAIDENAYLRPAVGTP